MRPERKIPFGQEQERMNTLNNAFPGRQDRNFHTLPPSAKEAGGGEAALSEAMKREKLNWYREVLELEPGSKVFLPFARLLVEQGYSCEAVDVLRQGLDAHPEFIEARLLLIDVLHREGRPAECGAEVARLAVLFKEYPGFWEAWSELCAADGSQADLSASLGLLGALLRNSRVTLAEVLSAGLRAMRCSVPDCAPGADSQENTPDGCTERAPEEQTREAHGEEEGSRIDEEAEASAVLAAEGGASVWEAAHEGKRAEVFPSTDEQDGAALSVEPQTVLDDIPDQNLGNAPAGDEPELEPARGIDAFRSAAELSEQSEQAEPEDGAESLSDTPEAPAEAASGTPAAREEKYSLRTRSMAEILAEQGDVRGAIDIYEELAASALPEDLPAIYRRLDSLRMPLGGASVPLSPPLAASSSSVTPASASSSSTMVLPSALVPGPDAMSSAGSSAPAHTGGTSSSRGILDMLEKLAVRLENRAR